LQDNEDDFVQMYTMKRNQTKLINEEEKLLQNELDDFLFEDQGGD